MPVWQRGEKQTSDQNKTDYDSEEEALRAYFEEARHAYLESAKRAYLAYLIKKNDVFNDDEDSDRERQKKLRKEIGRVLAERKRGG